MSSSNKAVLNYGDGKSVEFPVMKGTVGPDVVDIRTLYGKTGMFTYDPGFLSTASCQSRITYIDGDKGELLYRGTRSSSWRPSATFSRSATCCSKGNCPRPRRRRNS